MANPEAAVWNSTLLAGHDEFRRAMMEEAQATIERGREIDRAKRLSSPYQNIRRPVSAQRKIDAITTMHSSGNRHTESGRDWFTPFQWDAIKTLAMFGVYMSILSIPGATIVGLGAGVYAVYKLARYITDMSEKRRLTSQISRSTK